MLINSSKPMQKNKKLNYIYASGRRRTSSARARILKGKGITTVNSRPIDEYFPGAIFKEIWSKPFRTIDVEDKFYATVRVMGGGVKGQLEAVTHAVAKALAKESKEQFRPHLKKAGLLTRDSRTRERRKVGMGGKSRRKKQSPKR